MHRKLLLSALLLTSLSPVAQFQVISPKTKPEKSFAIIVDTTTHQAAAKEVEAYRAAVEKDGLAAYTLVGNWPTPESVNEAIRTYFHPERELTPPLEGVVFVGRIPVPMLRDAQHLTSAFKMDQVRYPIRRSSVPSDRFYDDFDLKFDFLQKDEKDPLLFYYSLRADSAQQVRREIYSARIYPPEKGAPGIARIRTYLARVARQKTAGPQLIQRMLLVAGHGYNSECLNAWRWEHLILQEQFPQLFFPGGWLRSYFHSMTYDLKEIIFRELQMKPVQLAIFHAHGGATTQYLLGNPESPSARVQVEELKRYLRSRLRRAKDRKKSVAEEQIKLMEGYGVPLSWFAGAFDPKVTAADDTLVAKQDIQAAEIGKLGPRAEVIIFDQCFNGRFIDQPCIAGEYVFGKGETVVAMANTVNVLQDIWLDQNLERLNWGTRVGKFHQRRHYLESHLIGDPTWRFAPTGGPRQNLDLLENDKYLPILGGDKWGHLNHPIIMRMYRLRKDLGERNTIDLARGLADPYEMIRRKTAFIMGDVGLDSYALPLLNTLIFDPGKRVSFVAKTALQKLDPKAVQKAWQTLLGTKGKYLPQDPAWRKRIVRLIAPPSWRKADLARLQDPKAPLKKRFSAARSFRNYRVHHCLPILLGMIQDPTTDVKLRVMLIEALGWFQYSHRRTEILTALKALLLTNGLPPLVVKETKKTLARLIAGANDPLTP